MDLVAALSATGFGQETIYGFRSNDKLVVSTAQFANFAAVLADAQQVGQNTVISADPSDRITLENFQLSGLKPNNLVFTNGAAAATVSLTIAGLPARRIASRVLQSKSDRSPPWTVSLVQAGADCQTVPVSTP